MTTISGPAQIAAQTPSRVPRDWSAVIKFVAVLILALVIVSPLFLLVVASLKADRFQILADMGSFRAFWVSDPTLQNFREVWTFSGALPFGRYLLNSLVILFVTVLGGVFLNSMAAFVLAWGPAAGAGDHPHRADRALYRPAGIDRPAAAHPRQPRRSFRQLRGADPALHGEPALYLPDLPVLHPGAARHL